MAPPSNRLPTESHWVPINWPTSMPRTIWEISSERGLLVRDFGNGPHIALAARREGMCPITLRLRRVPGLIGSGPMPLESLASWDQPNNPNLLVQAEIDKRVAAGGFIDRLSALQLAFSIEPAAGLPDLVNSYLSDKLPELKGGIVLSVECDHAIYMSQIAVARTLIRDLSFPGITQKAATDAKLFEGGIGLMSADGLGGASYLLPAVSAISPVQLGLVAHRGVGSIVILFPEPIRSPEDRHPASVADLHRPHYFTEPRRGLTVIGRAQAGDSEVFLTWWIEHWNRVLAELLDPATHRGHDGAFDPFLMLGRFVTHQRLLACAQSILVDSGLEEFTRMELFFEAIDLMEGLEGGIGSWRDLTTPTFAERELKRLKAELAASPEVDRVVMERCERGVEALVAMRDGFRDGQTRNANALDEGVFKFLRALRNAGHGLKGGQRSQDALVHLMGHRANVSPDLPELVWFHLIRMLCFSSWQ